MKPKQKIIVAGGGFAGIQLVRKLDANLFDILLIDKLNHHQFQPLFYQVATSQIEPSSISFPLRYIFKGKRNLQIRMAEITGIDKAGNRITTSIGAFDYDFLVLAVGCRTNFYHNQNVSRNALTLKSTYDAITIRNHILQTFESIISASDEEKKALLNLVIAGAGPTGVELAGAFAEIKMHILPKDYPGIDFSKFNIYLIEGSDNTLNRMSAASSDGAKAYLLKMGVIIYTKTMVKDYDGSCLLLNSGKSIKTKTVIWTAGITGNNIPGLGDTAAGPAGRYKVNRINRVAGCENIFAIGDISYMETPKYPHGHPQVANVGINQAKLLAANFSRIAKGKSTHEFEFSDPGTMATIGRNKAVVDLPFIRFKGHFAWFIWMSLHLMLILRVKNKLIIFINWAWAYITKNTSLRLILKPDKKTNDQ